MPWIDYITSLEDLNDQPAFVILYPTGLSGEFLASALADSIDAITQPPTENQDTGRTVYREFFNHALQWPHDINCQELIYRANIARNLYTSDNYIILAHPNYVSLKFLKQYLDRLPLIEITMRNTISHNFSSLASVAKIKSGTPLTVYRTRLPTAEYQHPKHLQIEWSDLILDCPGETFDLIQNFIGLLGNRAQFIQSVEEYRKRNQSLIKEASEI